MKKWIMIYVILAPLLFVLTADAAVGDRFEMVRGGVDRNYYNMAELFEYWEECGYPDYVGGVFSPGGSMSHLTVLLVGDDGSGEDQIRASLVNSYGLSFGKAKYSYNQLLEVNDEIVANHLVAGSKVYGVGVGWTSSGGEVTGFGESGKEFRVVVTVDESALTEYKDKFDLLYGDMVKVEAGTAMVPLNDTSD